ncbi:helix-turn-helix domain-containing protein [Couchioplanes caeruleus]|uniref:Transcriptional regulator n=2 Tax=Couchioplanes caeruleus TaxID=56438 RepID=A0A1K0FFP1_9ACTN|nr:helix-turn-helix transcriptional regulator [Couchioplanes caeruleus]OJF11663.1 transcriptional regulator [Couchioplanes caeruleus subsp. caeruleus]ROP27405.1 helix-turn-helix protein [Couchioplanes caeruleus]
MTALGTDGGTGSLVLRIRLGAQLRHLRKRREITREAAGWEIRASESKISRMELGRVPFKERDVADLLAFYGVPEDERDDLLTLARQASTPGWWQEFADVVPPWFLAYLGLEEAAALIRSYEVHFVPGLLQTGDYARAVIARGHAGLPATEIDRRLALRLGRQRVLHRANPPQFWTVMDETVLRRPVGGRAVMRGQLEALIKAADLPNVRIQVAPLGAASHAHAGLPFAILRFAEPELSDIVYIEQLTSALYLDKPNDVDHYFETMERACVAAEPPDRTPAMLRAILDETAGPAG